MHHKGANPAHLGEPVLVPGSMGGYGSVLKGEGNEECLTSAPHGAGRLVRPSRQTPPPEWLRRWLD